MNTLTTSLFFTAAGYVVGAAAGQILSSALSHSGIPLFSGLDSPIATSLQNGVGSVPISETTKAGLVNGGGIVGGVIGSSATISQAPVNYMTVAKTVIETGVLGSTGSAVAGMAYGTLDALKITGTNFMHRLGLRTNQQLI